jgi:hypothetical protein
VLHDGSFPAGRLSSLARSGASAERIFFTALNTLCFAAVALSPSSDLISSIDRPS